MASLITLSSIKSQKWYRQQTEATPYFIYLACRGCVAYFKSQDKVLWYCDPEEDRAYLEQNYIRALAEKHLAQEKNHLNFSQRLHAEWLNNIQLKNQRLFSKINQVDVSRISDAKLLSFNHSLGRQSYVMWLRFFMDIFDIDAESLIEQELIKKQVNLTADEKNTLTMPEKLMVNQDQELALLKIARFVKIDAQCIHLLNQIQTADTIHRLRLQPRLLSEIESYIKKYHWIRNSWAHTSIISVFDVVDQVKQIVSGSRDIVSEIRQLESYGKNLRKQKKVIIKKHRLAGWLARMFEMFALMTLWRDERKAQMQQLNYYLQLVGTEIAKRSRLDWDSIKVYDPLSVKTIPIKAQDLVRRAKLLKNNKLMYWDGQAVRHLDFQTSKRFVPALEDTFSVQMTEVRGLIACPGKVKGEVVVINKKSEFSKMMPGKILVTTMTRPDYLPLMKQAAAVVTDEGGITSHAAIVSRELKIPCIIGTQVATKVLKDGYQVEVNANHGVVLVLERANKSYNKN
ncbi:MAG: PEP-utilizing enzyme [Patescibacteria group bacterium]